MIMEVEEHRARLYETQLEEEKKADNVHKGFQGKIQGKKSIHELEDGLDDMDLHSLE